MKYSHTSIMKVFRKAGRFIGLSSLLLATTFWSFGGMDLYLGLTTPLLPKTAGAAYTGKQLRTIEYILGGGSDQTARTTNGQVAYAGSAWSITKGTAGQKSVVIAGSGIRVVNAYLDVSFAASSTGIMSGLDVFFDAQYSSVAGTDLRVTELAGNAPLSSYATALSGYMRGTHDVTAFFATTTDGQWNTGVGVTAGASTTFATAFVRTLTTIKLVVTYEQDVSATTHDEVKTVRFPLDSSNSNDTGTRQAVCAAATTCSFSYTADIPDAVNDADILSVSVEMHAQVDSALASSFQIGIRGGTGTSTFAWTEINADVPAVNFSWSPAVGSLDFTRNATDVIDVLNGTAAANVLGGELVVTYRYSTGAALQTETVRYFVDQDTVTPGTATSTFATSTVTIANSGKSVKNIWYRIHNAPVAAATFTIGSIVGTTTKKFRGYVLSGTNPRAGDTPTIIHDLSADVGGFFGTSVALGGESRSTVSNGAVGVEAFVTFTWDGDAASTVTKSVTYSGAQQGTNLTANTWYNRPVFVELPETVTKTYRSAYLSTNYAHSDTAALAIGTVTIGVNGSSTIITELTDGTNRPFNARYVSKIASSTFSGGDTIPWTSRALEINETRSVGDVAYFGNEVVVTYDAALGENGVTPAYKKQLRTVEYVLGGGSETTAQGTGVLSYAGSGWSTSKPSAGTRSIVLEGQDIRVVDAYLETAYYSTSSGNTTAMNVMMDVEGSSSSGSDVQVGEAVGVLVYSTSGLTGHVRGTHDVTALFDRQTDAQWAAGVDVVAGFSATMAAGNRSLTSMKLVVTYESDYFLVPHDEVKTVRFPLDSTAGTDTGTRTTVCAAGAICSFTYTATIPDAATDADILDVHFDVHAEVNSGTAGGNFDFQITSMPTPSALYAWGEVLNDDNTVDVLYAPPVGGNGFQRNTTQTLNIDNGTVPLNVLGGEVVVTYRYSTGATQQAETVRYFLHQGAATPGTTRTNFATITPTILNGEKVVKNIWYKVRAAPYGATNLTLNGRVGTSSENSKAYVIAATLPRSGQTPTIIHDLSASSTNYWAATTTLAGAVTFSAATGASASGAEAYISFVWNGSLGGTTTRSVLFSGAQQGVTNVANTRVNRPLRMELPESVTKTFRSAYLMVNHLHSNVTTISVGTITLSDGATTRTVTENGDTEAFTTAYFFSMASSSFSGGDTIPWAMRTIEVSQSKSVANYSYFSNVAVVTYDAAQEYKNPTFAQNYFRLYADNGALIPTDPWPAGAVNLGENTEVTAADAPPGNGANLRLRMSLQVATTTMLASSTSFSLQYAPRVTTCGAIGSWSALGTPGSGSEWRGYNATPADGTNLSTSTPAPGQLLLSVSDRAGMYGESVPTPVNPFVVAVGEDVEYDWNIQNNNAATDTPYCFRMVKADGTAFNDYVYYPTIRTAGYTAESHYWRWYGDANHETPTNPLAGENIAPSNVSNASVIKLRVTLNEVAGSNGVNQKFKVQYSEWADFSRGVFDVVATSSCLVNSLWCYGNGVDGDDDPITTILLTDAAQKGRHNEAATTTSTVGPLALTGTEFEFTLKHAGARANTVYFFRLWDNNHDRPVALAGGASYPSLATEGALLSTTVAGVASSTVTEGLTTGVDTTATTIPFGSVPIGTGGVIAAQRLTISTNATDGYQVFLKANANMISPSGSTIPVVSGTNATPLSWAAGCSGSASGCWGYHTGDDTLFGGSTRFLVDDTFAAPATTTYDEIISNSGPVDNEVTDLIYRLEAHAAQIAGQYTTQLQYIVVPIF